MRPPPHPRVSATPSALGFSRLPDTGFPYELVLENTVVGISYTLDRRHLWANERMAQIFGYEPGELDGAAVRILYSTQADYDEVGRMYSVFPRHNNGYTHERPMVKKNGEPLWCLISGRMIDPSDPRSPSVWVVQDISDKKHVEDQLRRSKERLEQTVERRTRNLRRTNEALSAEIERRRAAQLVSAEARAKYLALFRHMPLGVLVANASGEIVEVNRSLQGHLGAGTNEALLNLLADPTRAIDANEGPTSITEIVRLHVGGKVRRVGRFQIGWIAASGERRDFGVIAAPIPGHGLGMAFAFSDITEQRKRREREHAQQSALAHASRLSLMGQMSSALAHELGQPLNACQSYLSGLRHRLAAELGDRPEVAKALDKMSVHLDQAGEIIRNVRGFVSRHKPEFESTDLRTLLAQTLALLELPLRAGGVHVKVSAAAKLPKAHCHPVEVQQVLVNLCMNAIDALQSVPDERRLIDIQLSAGSRGMISVRVRDQGPGISEGVAARLFEPYITSKPAGLGMGLMICRTIVESHGGAIELVSTRARGACFQFTLRTARRKS